MTSPDRSSDDELYRGLIESLCREEQRYAHEVVDGVVVVVFDDCGDLRRVDLLVSRQQLRDLVTIASDPHGAGARLRAVTTSVHEALTALRFDEPFLVLFDGSFVGSTRRELPPRPGTPEASDELEGGFWSAHPVEDPRYGEPGSILGAGPGGETDRVSLVVSMDPVLDRGRYVFCDVDGELVDVDPVVRIREEGTTTLVVDQEVADANGWDYEGVSAMVTLRVHSSPGAVDLTSEITGALSERGIGCRVVAGLRNDRLLVPHDRGWDVLQALEDLRDVVTGTALGSAPGDDR